MIGNVTGIVDSMFASDHLRNQKNTANTKNGNSFYDCLNYALFNSEAGALFGNTSGTSLGYPNANPLSGSIWQAFALKALVDGMQKTGRASAIAAEDGQQDNKSAPVQAAAQKPDWAKIRVVRYYQSPAAQKAPVSNGILI